MRESAIESHVSGFAKRQGWLSFKWVSPGRPGVPDRLFFGPDQNLILVEFKAPGKKPRESQLHIHRRLGELGWPVYVIDNVDAGKDLFR